jgi:hypothetical protein
MLNKLPFVDFVDFVAIDFSSVLSVHSVAIHYFHADRNSSKCGLFSALR